MRLIALLLAGLITFPVVAAEKNSPRILIVVDASASMATSWPGQGGDRLGAVRAALDALEGVFRGRKLQPGVAVRVYGHQLRPDDPDACSDTQLIRPWDAADRGSLGKSLDSVKSRGAGSLVNALEKSASDLVSPSSNDIVLIILDGLDHCGGDLESAFANLTLGGKGANVHVFGFGLDPSDQAEISQNASFHNVGWPAQLLQSIAVMVSKSLSLPLQKELIGLDLNSANSLSFAPQKLEIVGSWAKEPMTVDLSQDKPRFEASLGTASITASGPEEDQVQKLLRVAVIPENILQLNFLGPLTTGLSAQVLESGWGRPPVLEVSWNDVPAQTALVLAEDGVPGASWFHSQIITDASGQASLPLPTTPMEMALQLRRPAGYATAVVDEVKFFSPGRRVILTAPADAEVGSSIGVSWVSESYPGDLINLVAADAPSESLGVTCDAIEGSPCDLFIPLDRCSYEIRYIDGRSFEVLARTKLEVGGQTAGILAPSSVSISEPVNVRWWGPAGPLDVITLNNINSEAAEYIDWASPSDGSPARIQAPLISGDYEVRYLVAGKDVVASSQISIESIPVTLEVAKKVRVGERLRIAWTGPNGPDDFLVLVRKGQNIKRQLDFAYVASGSPITMAAPDRPGPYEIRYVSAHPREVLATAEFKVIK